MFKGKIRMNSPCELRKPLGMGVMGQLSNFKGDSLFNNPKPSKKSS